jgi:hypothetical protein
MGKLLNLNKFFPLLTLVIAMASLTLGTAKLSWADSLREEIGEFHHFLREHPRIAVHLQRDPRLANNSRFLNDHDNLREFLRNHPRVRRELAVNPARVIGRSYAWDYRRYDDRSYGYNPRYDRWGRR